MPAWYAERCVSLRVPGLADPGIGRSWVRRLLGAWMGPVDGGGFGRCGVRLDVSTYQTRSTGDILFIAIVDFSTTATDRARALGQLEGERAHVRSMRGNMAFRVFASREDDRTVTVVHEWADQDSFAAYLASEAFARSNAVLRPMVTEGPVSRRFRGELVESVA